MKKLTFTLVLIFALNSLVSGQGFMQSVFEIRYNATSCLYEAHLHVGGTLDPAGMDNLLGPSGFCIAIPASAPNKIIACNTLNPAGAGWSDNTPVYDILTFDGYKDYHKFTTNGAQFIPALTPGADIVLFTFTLPNFICPSGIRMFENNSPSPSPTPDTNPPGCTFDNSFQTLWGETYTDNTGSPVVLPIPGVSSSYLLSCNLNNLFLSSVGSTVLGCNILKYNWSGPNGFTSNLQSPILNSYTAPGTYIVTVTDANNCSNTSTVTIAQPAQVLNSTAVFSHASCGNNNGSINLTVTGGTPPYTYIWSNGAITEDINNLTPGIYSAIVTDISGCITTFSVSISQQNNVFADAGPDAIYNGIPVLLGNIANGPGTITWSPSEGLNSPNIAQPLASPSVTTTYTLSVNNNGCIASDAVTVTSVSAGHTISGKTKYAGKANTGNPSPNFPYYNAMKYNIDNVIVILKTTTGVELARDTSDNYGNYLITNVADGSYLLTYQKFSTDTMLWGNDINATDVSILKYFVTNDTAQDPSRNFSAIYKKAANVDNNQFINVIDITRIKAKIASPYDPSRNFPKGNWVPLDTIIDVAGADLNITLPVICYGDYNASCIRYMDSASLWSQAKTLQEDNIIYPSEENIIITKSGLIKVPFCIGTTMNEFSGMQLKLNYPNDKFELISAYMSKSGDKYGSVKINPTLEEIMRDDNDLLVADDNGIIRVLYVTTNHFNIEANDEIITLCFRPLIKLKEFETGLDISGSGIFVNHYGEENPDEYLLMPKIMVQPNNTEDEVDFASYPNPFKSNANLTYYLPETGIVRLNVYNSTGALVSILANENQENGKHTITFNPENLPAGIYTCKLEFTGKNISTRQILKLIH